VELERPRSRPKLCATISRTREALGDDPLSEKHQWGCGWCRECRRAWSAMDRLQLRGLAHLAEESPPSSVWWTRTIRRSFCPRTCRPLWANFCRRTGQQCRLILGAVAAGLGNLAATLSLGAGTLENCLGRRLDHGPCGGGGGQNALLRQFTADACNRQVLAGPVEAPPWVTSWSRPSAWGLLNSMADAAKSSATPSELRA